MKDKKILIGTALILLLLLTTGLSYAYFSTSVKGNDNAKDMVVEAGTLKLTYTDGSEIKVENIRPGKTITKEVSVKNTGTLDTNYNIVWQSLVNEITNDELVLSATCERVNSAGTTEGTCNAISQSPISNTTIEKKISIKSGITHKYTFTILFKDTNADQNYNQGKKFSGVLGIEKYKDTAVYCKTDVELVQGAEYSDALYTYRYMQEGTKTGWQNIDTDGWGVKLNANFENGDVGGKICTYINNKPVISTSYMFSGTVGKNVYIDISEYNTSEVKSMKGMFMESKIPNDFSSLDTSNVTNMSYMFSTNSLETLDLSSFNTNKVIDMSYMFYNSTATTLDLSSFNTSKVTDISSMFESCMINRIYASSKFDASKISKNKNMFKYCLNLIGGAGTTIDDNHIDGDYAHIDGGTSNPGYFTDIADKK